MGDCKDWIKQPPPMRQMGDWIKRLPHANVRQGSRELGVYENRCSASLYDEPISVRLSPVCGCLLLRICIEIPEGLTE